MKITEKQLRQTIRQVISESEQNNVNEISGIMDKISGVFNKNEDFKAPNISPERLKFIKKCFFAKIGQIMLYPTQSTRAELIRNGDLKSYFKSASEALGLDLKKSKKESTNNSKEFVRSFLFEFDSNDLTLDEAVVIRNLLQSEKIRF